MQEIKIAHDSNPEDAIEAIEKIFNDFEIKFEREDCEGSANIYFRYEKIKNIINAPEVP